MLLTELLHELVVVTTDAPDSRSALGAVLKEICAYAGWEYGEGWLAGSDASKGQESLRLASTWHIADEKMAQFARQRVRQATHGNDQLVGRAWISREAVQINLVQGATGTESGFTGAIAIPLVSGEEAVGILAFFTAGPKEDDSDIRESLANIGPIVAALLRSQLNTDKGEIEVQRKRADRAKRSQEAAEVANKATSDFLSRMSHELRTPLNSIIGFADLLFMEGLEQRHRENLGYIRQAGQHLLQLVNEVLDITSIESGSISFSLEPVRVAELVQEALDLVRPLAAPRNVKLENQSLTNTNDLYVMADRQRLKQVLLNLLSNAIKYNVEGGRVIISVQEVENGNVSISVADTGIGIDPQQMDKLYMPFERLGAERLGAEGTGLGLALTKRLIEAMNGTIEVESKLGQGTRFQVEMKSAEPPTMSSKDLATVPISASQIPGYTAMVLYVEDNLSNIRLVERILEHRQGLRLISCMQGRMALDIARDHRPDVILLDLHLPDMTGAEVLDALKADPVTQSIPVVIISADATAGTLERLMAAGAFGYITKPIEVRRFLRLLDETLK